MGVSATHLDWTLVPYVRKSFIKHYKDGMKYICECEEELDFSLERTIEDEYYKNKHPKAYKYAYEQTCKETHQAVEGLFHNLNTLQSRSGNQLKISGWLYRNI